MWQTRGKKIYISPIYIYIYIAPYRWQVSRPQGAQTWITQLNLQTTPCLPLAFVRIHQMAPPRTVVTTASCSLILIYRPRMDERLSWPSWLTYSGRFTHISGHPSAIGRAQDRESSPVKRPTFYRWATEPTIEAQLLLTVTVILTMTHVNFILVHNVTQHYTTLIKLYARRTM